MIDYDTIQRIQSAARIVDVVSDFVSLRKAGANYKGLCPFHPDKTPSMMVSPAKNIFKCFACNEGGTPIHFIMKHESLSYAEALKYIAKKYGIEVKETEMTDEQRQVQNDRESMFILNGFAQKTFTENLFDSEEGRTIGLSYFHERGFRDDIIKKFQLGYSLEERDAFTKQALKAGYKLDFLIKTGLTVTGENNYRADRFRGRVMFPVLSLSGKVVAFGGRTLKNDKAKYVNSIDSEIYNKSSELYGIYLARHAITKQDKCFLVEGYTDVISMHQAGIENVVAASGTALPPGQIRLITRFTKNVTILRDGDSAGLKAAVRDINLLLDAGLNIKIVVLPEGEDPDSFARKHNATEFAEYIAENETDFVRFKASTLMKDSANDPMKQSALITDIADTIGLIPEEIVRLVYVKECSNLLNIDERALVRRVNQARQKHLEEKKKDLYREARGDDRPPEPPEPELPPAPDFPPTDFRPIKKFPLDSFERDILYYIIRYGEVTLNNKKEGEHNPEPENAPCVIEFIINGLKIDGLQLENPVYQEIIDESAEKYKSGGFSPAKYFRNHVNPIISKIAADLSTNKYVESRIHTKHNPVLKEEERLLDKVNYVIMHYKSAVLQKMIDEQNALLKAAEAKGDWEETMKILANLKEYSEKQKIASSLLGERVIMPF
ncbi:MAG: DNA primase [Dysgonamonadaceae bacterium]|nr:DNA primase [Dysgonamonadaceae bacterium]